MQLILNRDEFEAIWPYSGSPPEAKDYPKHYPCLCDKDRIDFGIMGDGWRVEVIYFPDFKHLGPRAAFIAGVEAKRETLFEG